MCLVTWSPAWWTSCFSGDTLFVFLSYILLSCFWQIKWWWWCPRLQLLTVYLPNDSPDANVPQSDEPDTCPEVVKFMVSKWLADDVTVAVGQKICYTNRRHRSSLIPFTIVRRVRYVRICYCYSQMTVRPAAFVLIGNPYSLLLASVVGARNKWLFQVCNENNPFANPWRPAISRSHSGAMQRS